MVQLSVCNTAPLSNAVLANGFCAGTIPVIVQQPRSITALGIADFVTLERKTGSVLVGEDLDGDGIPESLRNLITLPGANHGLAVTSTHIYVSKPTEVHRWQFNSTSKTIPPNTQQETVVYNMNADGQGGAPFGHSTRTLAFHEASNELYVSVGSFGNIDADSYRSRIRRFFIGNASLFPIDFVTGEVFADGLRNEVAMEFAPDGILWGAQNSGDNLFRADLGGDIHHDNPAEEVHRFYRAGMSFGYPYCWREYNLPLLGRGRGTAWAWPNTSVTLSKYVTDEQCRSEYDAPVLAVQAHSAPLGITFYQYKAVRPVECNGVSPFPPEMDGFAFLAFHGSWNRIPPTGYKVVYVPITANGTVVGGIGANPIDLLWHDGDDEARWEDGFRPVDVSFDACGRLLVTSDGTFIADNVVVGDKIIRIENSANIAPSQAPSQAPSSSQTPSNAPSSSQTPSQAPSRVPSQKPSRAPSKVPSRKPSKAPSKPPSKAPSKPPSKAPSKPPSISPSKAPSKTPSKRPLAMLVPPPTIVSPPSRPTMPTTSTIPNAPAPMAPPPPSRTIPDAPAPMGPLPVARVPTKVPSRKPNVAPTRVPTKAPAAKSSMTPSRAPSNGPSQRPSVLPSIQPLTMPLPTMIVPSPTIPRVPSAPVPPPSSPRPPPRPNGGLFGRMRAWIKKLFCG